MDLASIAHQYLDRLKARHGHSITPDQWSALNAILGCRTAQYGQAHFSCDDCGWKKSAYLSCGHRMCNRCQNHTTTQWLDRQCAKLLPVEYFMATFTLPRELRALAKANKTVVYSALMKCAVSTLKTFGLNDKYLAAELAMTAILHTHTRELDYHPHVHIVIPGGGVANKRTRWRQAKGKYLFNEFNLAAVFRGKLLRALEKSRLPLPKTPKKWVMQCKHVGRGLPALQYLSRYLYRGVINNKNLISDDGKSVTFRYKDSNTGQLKRRQLPGEDFLQLLLQHTLPKGFRRARDYGFLHGNAKRILTLVQLVLKVTVPVPTGKQGPKLICKICRGFMSVLSVDREPFLSG